MLADGRRSDAVERSRSGKALRLVLAVEQLLEPRLCLLAEAAVSDFGIEAQARANGCDSPASAELARIAAMRRAVAGRVDRGRAAGFTRGVARLAAAPFPRLTLATH